MEAELDERALYDAAYVRYLNGKKTCPFSCHDLNKAKRNVAGVMKTFGLPTLEDLQVLDVGCGLGFVAEALRQQGAHVTAVDSSGIAIDAVNELFPAVSARVASFPQDFTEGRQYDLIWAGDFSLLNTFDVAFICREFVEPALRLLRDDGALIIGWHTNFGGTMGDSHWAHWPFEMITNLTKNAQLLGPHVVTFPPSVFSKGVMRIGAMLEKSIPIYFFRRFRAEATSGN